MATWLGGAPHLRNKLRQAKELWRNGLMRVLRAVTLFLSSSVSVGFLSVCRDAESKRRRTETSLGGEG